MNPVLLAALINNLAIPEIGRWLAQLHAEGKVVTEAAALEKLGLDVDGGNAAGQAFLDTHPQP
jgi:hypothetical protein